MERLNVDESDWGCIKVTGNDRIAFLQSMVTADVSKLHPGDWTRASLLDVKGRVQSFFDIVLRKDYVLLLTEPVLTDKTRELLAKHAIMDDVELELTETPQHRVWREPAECWRGATPVFSPCPEPIAEPEQVEVRRVEAGIPRYGIDIDDKSFPFESPLRDYIDYEKGCYLGQEPVARVKSRGQANRSLLGLRIDGDEAVEVGARLSHPERDDAGTVTSSVVSAHFGAIALAYVHRSVWTPGTELWVAGRRAVVSEIPFVADED